MTDVIALVVAGILIPISALHFIWATGRPWPMRDREGLARTVIGSERSLTHPPTGLVTACVALLILVAAVLPLCLAGLVASPLPPWTLRGLVALQALVFLARGFVGYSAWGRQAAPLEPFRTYNLRFYNPLILALGLLCGLLAALETGG